MSSTEELFMVLAVAKVYFNKQLMHISKHHIVLYKYVQLYVSLRNTIKLENLSNICFKSNIETSRRLS